MCVCVCVCVCVRACVLMSACVFISILVCYSVTFVADLDAVVQRSFDVGVEKVAMIVHAHIMYASMYVLIQIRCACINIIIVSDHSNWWKPQGLPRSTGSSQN